MSSPSHQPYIFPHFLHTHHFLPSLRALFPPYAPLTSLTPRALALFLTRPPPYPPLTLDVLIHAIPIKERPEALESFLLAIPTAPKYNSLKRRILLAALAAHLQTGSKNAERNAADLAERSIAKNAYSEDPVLIGYTGYIHYRRWKREIEEYRGRLAEKETTSQRNSQSKKEDDYDLEDTEFTFEQPRATKRFETPEAGEHYNNAIHAFQNCLDCAQRVYKRKVLHVDHDEEPYSGPESDHEQEAPLGEGDEKISKKLRHTLEKDLELNIQPVNMELYMYYYAKVAASSVHHNAIIDFV